MLETSAANEISQPGFDRLKNLPFNLRIENAAAFVLSECIDKGLLKDISATKKSQLIEHSKEGIRSMIKSVSWSWKVWNYAFYHYI